MGKAAQQKKQKKLEKKAVSVEDLPFVSICTPTYNRRPFIPYIIKCFEHQTYPREKMEWIIIDDGTDKVEDLFAHLPYVKYYRYEEKMLLGRKRNLMHEKASGDIIVYMDDDDYYPPERVSHAVETLQKNNRALCAGSSRLHLYFKHIGKMYEFGPYGPNHATAATFAFKRELLKQTKYDDTQTLAEERKFLKEYTIPFVQLNPLKTILVFSHIQNSFDKKILLENKNDPNIRECSIRVEDYVKEEDIKHFFMEDIDGILSSYEPGNPENKKDVMKQLNEITEKRHKMIAEHQKALEAQHLQDMKMKKPQEYIAMIDNKMNEQTIMLQNLINENNALKERNKLLEERLRKYVEEQVERLKKEKEQGNVFKIPV